MAAQRQPRPAGGGPALFPFINGQLAALGGLLPPTSLFGEQRAPAVELMDGGAFVQELRQPKALEGRAFYFSGRLVELTAAHISSHAGRSVLRMLLPLLLLKE